MNFSTFNNTLKRLASLRARQGSAGKPVQLVNECGEVFRTGRNLRVILDYARKFKWDETHLGQEGTTLSVIFPEGSTCKVEFADAAVLKEWIANRIKYGRGRFDRQLPNERPHDPRRITAQRAFFKSKGY